MCQALSPSPVLRDKKCKVCRQTFTPRRPIQPCCGYKCEVVATERALAKKAEKAAREDRKMTRAKLEALKRLPVLKQEAQQAFNRYIRLRDTGGQCFVCGDPIRIGGIGGGFDAGHIRARSEADHLRYDERNVWGQCKPCNASGSTKPHEMRAAAERKLGPEVAAELYADNRVVKWTRDGLRAIRDEYRAKARALAVAESTT